MKRLVFIFVVIFISFSIDSSAVPDFPVGASFRLDRFPNTAPVGYDPVIGEYQY